MAEGKAAVDEGGGAPKPPGAGGGAKPNPGVVGAWLGNAEGNGVPGGGNALRSGIIPNGVVFVYGFVCFGKLAFGFDTTGLGALDERFSCRDESIICVFWLSGARSGSSGLSEPSGLT